MKITIIGSGIYGKSMANILSKKNDIIMWTEKENIEDILIPENIKITNNMEKAIQESKLIFILTSAKYVPSILEQIKKYAKNDMIFLIGSKGILEDGTTLEECFKENLTNNKYAIIAGPTFAIDITNNDPIGFTIATKYIKDYYLISSAFKNVKLEYTDDTTGIEMCGVLKNAYAIGSGIIESFNYGPSTKNLYISLVIFEIKQILKRISNENTLNTLAGIGDLIMTCSSLNSRNYTYGKLLGNNNKEKQLEYLKTNTVEGLDNIRVLHKLLKEKGIDAPILNTIYKCIYENLAVKNIIDLLLQ